MALLTPQGGRKILRLKIGDAPKCPFVGHDFTVNIHLVDDSGQLKCGDEIPLIMKLCFQEKPLRPCPDNLLDIRNADNPEQDPKDFTISKTGSIRLTIRINELSMRFDNKKLVLCASTENVNGLYVQSAISLPMLCVKYRLVIQRNNIPDVWFKDEGGRDKCIEVNISLRDHKNDIITERKVPLKVVLLYADGNTVLKQEILKISPDSKLHLDEKGQASLRLRIDDVSKNHQKQSFVIQIAPDTKSQPLNNDISPDECSALEVRSKRNKTKRPREDDSATTSGNSAAQKIAAASTRTSAITLAASAIAPTAKTVPPVNLAAPSHHQPAPDVQTVSRTVMEKTALENKRLNDLMSNFDKDEERKGDAPTREQVGDAISGLVEWSQAMMEAVASLQWQFIGNEKLANGVLHPTYEFRNPNNTITDLFSRYHDIAVPSLTMLYHNHFSHGNGVESFVKSEPKSSQDVVPGYIPLPKSSTGLASFSGLPLTSPLNINFPSPAGTVSSRSELFASNIGKNFSTDSKFSQASAITLGIPNSLPPANSTGHTVKAVNFASNINRFSSTSSSVSNPSGAPMPEFDGSVPSSAFQDSMPVFSNNSTAEFLREWSFDTMNSLGGNSKPQNYSNAFYILAKRFYSKLVTSPLGCPTYDMNRNLIGFFVSKSDKDASNSLMEATSANLVTLEDYPANLFTPEEILEANRIANELIDANVNGVYLRAYYSDESTFIEDAMIHLYDYAEDICLTK